MTTQRFLTIATKNAHPLPPLLIERAEALGYELKSRTETLAVLTSTHAVVTSFRGGRGFVIGHILEGSPSVTDSGSDESVGSDLVQTIWGGYVAIWESATARNAWVMTDPSGAIPGYYCTAPGDVTILGSTPRDIEKVRGERFAIDWPIVDQLLRCSYSRSRRTALAGLYELYPGHVMSLADQTLRVVWSPWTFACAERFVGDFAEGSKLVRSSVDRAIEGWSKPFGTILLKLSGGLDSSIVAAAIKEAAHPNTTCLTISSGVATGNEADFARAVTERCNLPLIESALDAGDIDLDRSSAESCPRPVGRPFSQSVEAVSSRHAEVIGADAMFHGGGGDNVFCYLTSVAPVLDHILAGNGWKGSWRAIRDICGVTGADVGTAGRLVVRRLLARRLDFPLATDPSLLQPSCEDFAGDDLPHPWLDPPPSALPGSRAHVALILAIYNYLESMQGKMLDTPCVAPLMSQPVIEACLMVPTWLWIKGGRNRSVARAAFEDCLPSQIINRVSKGTPDGFSIKFFERNRSALHERLMEGPLARAGIIDRQAIDETFRRNSFGRDFNQSRLLSLCDANAWASSWLS